MLIALLAAYLLGGGSGVAGAILTPQAVQQISKQVKTVVAEEARAEAATETLAELKGAVKAFDKDFKRSGKELTRLYKDHDGEAERMTEVLDELNSSWAGAQKRAVELRFRLRESLTEEEWAAVFGDS